MKIHSVILKLVHVEKWKDRRTDMAKLTGTFLQLFAVNAPKNVTEIKTSNIKLRTKDTQKSRSKI
jgi:hypothetical protein